jgi:hypothetical protein
MFRRLPAEKPMPEKQEVVRKKPGFIMEGSRLIFGQVWDIYMKIMLGTTCSISQKLELSDVLTLSRDNLVMEH